MAFTNPFVVAKGVANPFFPDDEVGSSDLPLWQREELLERLGGATKTTASSILGALSVPGSILYDVARGKPLGSGSTAGEALDSYGLRPSEDALGGWGRPISELGLDIVSDPLNLVTFGAGTASRAARAAKAAGLMDDVTRVASRSLIDDVSQGARNIDTLGDMGHARNAARSFSDNFGQGLGNLSDDDLLSRPLVGSRTAARQTRLRDLVQSQADPTDAIRRLDNALSPEGFSYADVADEFLGNDIGLRLPKIMGGEIAMQLPNWAGGRASAAALDRAGQAVRWSWPGRHAVAASNVFGDTVLGTVDEGDQILAKTQVRRDAASTVRARTRINELTRGLNEAAPELFTNQRLASAFRNVAEGVADQADQQLVAAHNLDPFVERWRQLREEYITRSREAGIGSGELDDAYGAEYFPRAVDTDIWRRGSAPADGGRQYSVMTGDQLARSAAYSVPGATQTLNRLSRDAAVHQAVTDGEAADYILTEMNREVQRLNQGRAAGDLLPAYTRQNAIKLARDIRAMRPEAVEAGRGIFDSHPLEEMSRYILGREKALGRTGAIYDKIGNTAALQNYLDVPTHILGRHNPLNQTLANLDLRTVEMPTLGPVHPNAPLTRGQARVQGPAIQQFLPNQTLGARQQIVDRLNARLAGTGQSITLDDLTNVSVDAALVERFNRIADFYTVPEVQGAWVEALDGITNSWKTSVLSWPARYLRDWYSGIATNLVEAGHSGLLSGYSAAKHLIQGQADRLESIVARMPEYAQQAAVDPAGAVRRYQDDMAIHGLTSGRRLEDYGARLTGRQTGQDALADMVPGSTPATTVGYQVWDAINAPITGRMPLGPSAAAYSELGNVRAYGDSLRRFGQAINPFNDEVRFVDYLGEKELRDPILRWSAKEGDTTDRLNRLAGYNALLLQGVSPAEAVRRTMRSQVNYENLSRFERNAIRRVVPFWTYSSRTGAYIAERIWNDPGGRYTQAILRAPDKLQEVGRDGEYTPQQIKSSGGFSLEPLRQIPGIGGLIDTIAPETDGVQSYLADIDLPGIDLLNMVRLRSDLDGSPQIGNSLYQTALGVTSQLMHPGLRAGVELLTDQNLHTGKRLSEYEPTTQKIGRSLGVEPFSSLDSGLKYGSYLADYIPHAPRVMQLANRLLDDERVPDLQARVLQNAVNMLSGVKVQNIAEDAARLDASRELSQMLEDSPALRTFEQRFIPKEMLPYASPEDVLLYRLDRQMRQEARRARKATKPDDNPFFN